MYTSVAAITCLATDGTEPTVHKIPQTPDISNCDPLYDGIWYKHAAITAFYHTYHINTLYYPNSCNNLKRNILNPWCFALVLCPYLNLCLCCLKVPTGN